MLLGQIAWVDIIVFLTFLIPQLFINVSIVELLSVAATAIPFLTTRLPYDFIKEQCFTQKANRSPFCQQASLFEDVVIRCVRFAFARIPASVGRVFFSKAVALPFMRFRMLRHGYARAPMHWEEIAKDNLRGVWMIEDPETEPDLVVYYAHGGGFSMGSGFFYLEFLMTLAGLLRQHASQSFTNPAIFALEYTLVPEASHPQQLEETIAGYEYVLEKVHCDASRICISGDSAGATLMLNLLLHRAGQDAGDDENNDAGNAKSNEDAGDDQNNDASVSAGLTKLPIPALALLISPWCTLASPLDANTPSDFLDVTNLRQYATQFCGEQPSSRNSKRKIYALDDPRVSPGNCTSLSHWRRATPTAGFVVLCGAEEVFAPQIDALAKIWQASGARTRVHQEKGGVHAWPVACLFLSSCMEERTKGLRRIVDAICERMGKAKGSAAKR